MKEWLFSLIPYFIGYTFIQLSGVTDGMNYGQELALIVGIVFLALGVWES